MSEQKKFEDIINEALTGDTQKNALDFVAFLRTSGFTNDDEYNNNFYYMGDPTSVLLCFNHADYSAASKT